MSFNELTKINVCVTKYPNIRSLYLHGNAIDNFNEIKKLKTMPNLRRLTLHGNPLGEFFQLFYYLYNSRSINLKINQSYSDHIPQYRACVISQLPQLKSFDFSGVTKNDRFVSANINVKKIRKSAAWKKEETTMTILLCITHDWIKHTYMQTLFIFLNKNIFFQQIAYYSITIFTSKRKSSANRSCQQCIG